MNKNIWRSLAVFTWIIGLVSLLTMFQQLKENYLNYMSIDTINLGFQHAWPTSLIFASIGSMYLVLLVFVAITIVRKKPSNKTLLILAIAFLTLKFAVQAYFKVSINQSSMAITPLLDRVLLLCRTMDTNTNFIFVYAPESNYFATNSLLSTEVIPISFLFLGLFLGWTNKKYFVIVSMVAVVVTILVGFSTYHYNNLYFDISGVFSILSVGLFILSYSFNSLSTAQRVQGVAI